MSTVQSFLPNLMGIEIFIVIKNQSFPHEVATEMDRVVDWYFG